MKWSERIQNASIWLMALVAVGGYACGRGSVLAANGAVDWVPVMLFASAALAVCDMFYDRRWARPASAAIQASAAITLLGISIVASWSPGGCLLAACLLAGAVLTWRDRRELADRDQDDQDEEAMHSIVLLMRESRYLDSAILQRLASDAWGAEVEIADEEDEEGLSGLGLHHGQWGGPRPPEPQRHESLPTLFGDESPYMCLYWPALLAIHNTPAPYFDNVADVLEEIDDQRVARAVREHHAWLSVDLISWMDDTEPRFDAVDRLIGQLLAELADDENCLAVIDLTNGRIYPFDPQTCEKLRDQSPRQALAEPYYAPVVAVDDEEMRRAVDQARRRWPEFVAAFENRGDDDRFNVKAKFVADNTVEYIWVSVNAIEANTIYGELGNEPLHVGGKIGDRVRVAFEDLNDWLHVDAQGVRSGGFTIEVLSRRRRDDH